MRICVDMILEKLSMDRIRFLLVLPSRSRRTVSLTISEWEDVRNHCKSSSFCWLGLKEIPVKEEVIRWDLNGTYTNDIIAEGVKKSLNNRDPMKPTFTFLSLQAVHSPLQAPEKYIEMYRHIKDKKRRNYNAMTTAMDDMIGDVVKTYKDLVRFRMTLPTIDLSQRILYE